MKLGRKEAIFASVASVVTWVAGRARAQTNSLPTPADPRSLQDQIDDLKKQLQALTPIAISPIIGFTQGSNGDLVLNAPGNVTINAARAFSVSALTASVTAVATATVSGNGVVAIKGGVVSLN